MEIKYVILIAGVAGMSFVAGFETAHYVIKRMMTRELKKEEVNCK